MGSSPAGRANSVPTRVSAVAPFPETLEKANAHPLHDAIESFLLTKRVGGCTPHALRHLAATSWLRGGAGLDEVRRLLGREPLNTIPRYSSLVGADLQRTHRKAGGADS